MASPERPNVDPELYNIMRDCDVFYGGRVEVFRNLSQADLDYGEEISYIDVVSHYPNICAFHRLCTGHPEKLLGDDIDLTRLVPGGDNNYFGYFRAYVTPRADDLYGGLPKRSEKGGLEFSNKPGIYIGFIEELLERVENGTVINHVYEVLHFDEKNSIVGPFKGFLLP